MLTRGWGFGTKVRGCQTPRSMDQSSLIAGIPLAHSPKLSFSLTVELSVFMLVCAKLLHVEPQGPTAVRGIFCVTVPKLT